MLCSQHAGEVAVDSDTTPLLHLQDSKGFAVNTLVKVDYEPHPLFFRILALDHARNQLQVPNCGILWRPGKGLLELLTSEHVRSCRCCPGPWTGLAWPGLRAACAAHVQLLCAV